MSIFTNLHCNCPTLDLSLLSCVHPSLPNCLFFLGGGGIPSIFGTLSIYAAERSCALRTTSNDSRGLPHILRKILSGLGRWYTSRSSLKFLHSSSYPLLGFQGVTDLRVYGLAYQRGVGEDGKVISAYIIVCQSVPFLHTRPTLTKSLFSLNCRWR